MTIAARQLDAARRLLIDVAPDFDAAPLYFEPLPAGYPLPANLRAFTQWPIDSALRRSLIASGKWNGPGTSIFLVAGVDNWESLAGIALHEAAHNLPFRQPPEDCEPSAAEVEREGELIALWAAEPTTQLPGLPPWLNHDATFVRACLHLAYRAEQLGESIPLPALHCAGWEYELSGAWRYRRALGDEPQQMVSRSFAEIHATPAPREFVELFEADVAVWHKTHPQPKED